MSANTPNHLSNCPKCRSPMLVINKRNRSDYIYRRRVCSNCEYAFSTQERAANEGRGRPLEEKTPQTRLDALIKRFMRRYYQRLPADEQVKFLNQLEKEIR